MNAIQAVGVGEEGFVSFLHELKRLRVLDHDELLAWLRLHGDVIRLIEPPLDEEALRELALELGGQVSELPPAVRAERSPEGGAA